MSTTILFVDTEFNNKQLISIGLVDTAGHEFYAEIKGITPSKCSNFVFDTVLPLLSNNNPETMLEVSERLNDWLKAFTGPIKLVYDYDDDLGHFRSLTKVNVEPVFLSIQGDDENDIYADTLDLFFLAHDRHHALNDAKALKTAVLAVADISPAFAKKIGLN